MPSDDHPVFGSINLDAKDLSTLSLGSTEDGDLYYHSGESTITADGSNTSEAGYYRWDNDNSEWSSGGEGGWSSYASSWTINQLQAQRGLPIPQFVKSSNNPVIDGNDVNWGTADQANWISIIPTDPISNPNGNFYAYVASHDEAGTGVFWIDDLTNDSWTAYSSNSIDQNGYQEASAIWNPDDNEVWLYANKGGTSQGVALQRSADGLTSWTDDGTIIAFAGGSFTGVPYKTASGIGSHAGYPRAFWTTEGVYLSSWQKPMEEEPTRSMLRWSSDGKTSWRWIPHTWEGGRQRYYANNLDYCPYVLGGTAGWLCVWNENDGSGNKQIGMGFTTDGIRIRKLGVALTQDQSWEGSNVSKPHLVWGSGPKLHLFYNGEGSTTDNAIGRATDDFARLGV